GGARRSRATLVLPHSGWSALLPKPVIERKPLSSRQRASRASTASRARRDRRGGGKRGWGARAPDVGRRAPTGRTPRARTRPRAGPPGPTRPRAEYETPSARAARARGDGYGRNLAALPEGAGAPDSSDRGRTRRRWRGRD